VRNRRRVAIVATHPIQYYVPWYRALARAVDLDVYFCHRQTRAGQAAAGFDVEFEWDVPLFGGYRHTFLRNTSRWPSPESFAGCNTPDIASIIAREEFDAVIVHGWSTVSYWQAMRACWRTGTPVLVRGDSTLATPRAAWRRLAKWPLFRAFIPRFDGYLIVGRPAKEYLLHYGADPSRCFDAPHAVDNRFFAARAEPLRADRAALRRSLSLPPDGVVALFVGRLVAGKGLDIFVGALARAAGVVPQIAGLVVGDGPLRETTTQAAASSSAPVQFAGFLNQTEIARAYAAADLLVVPSASETWGLVVNEAMACGLPVVVSDRVGCARDLVLPGVTGEIVPVGDVGRLANVTVRLARAPGRRPRMGDAARRHIAAFDVEKAAEGTILAVEALAARRRRPTRRLETSDVSHGSSLS
jgi:glycosyltransferase involved in cell wall biosynthesis